ncbi:MAG: threonine/serine exporter family protein [Clostridiales bacterium]|nr:threonine/serine exporter family protein [Clostridiales bacterium]
MGEAIKLIICSFGSALCIGAVYQIRREYLIFAGLGGAVTRVVWLLVRECTAESFIYYFFAALAAGLYAEYLAVRTKNPSTVFLYPSIIPLTPGRSFYFSMIGLILKDSALLSEHLEVCIHSLVGLGIGFAIVSIVMHYQRRYHWIKKKQMQRMMEEEKYGRV